MKSPDQYRIYVPKSVVHEDQHGHYLWLADLHRGRATKQRITVGGRQTTSLCEVTAGLNEASRVIVAGADRVGDGERITIREASQVQDHSAMLGSATASTRFP